MADRPPNVAASVRQRLRNLANKNNQNFELVLRRYALERALYRLSQSKFQEEFVLKGAMLQAVWMENPFRHTRDLDLHARGKEDASRVHDAFLTILDAQVQDDGVVFDIENLTSQPIRENASYGGIRVKTTATLGAARIPVVIDVGFGDAITPKPEVVEYPSLLDLPRPRLLAYPRETVVAEKFEAMVALGLANSRMKDFHDVAVLASTFEFEGPPLVKALAATFRRRGTHLPKEAPPALTDAFLKRPETVALWKAFVTRESILEEYSDLEALIALLRSFLLQPAIAASDQTDFPLRWPARGPWTGH